MGKYKGIEARYKVVSVRVDDDLFSDIKNLVPRGVTLSTYLRDLLRRECSVYLEECERAAIEFGRSSL